MIPTDGPATALTTVVKGELFHALPWPLPGGRAMLYTVRRRQFSWGDEEVVAYTFATGAKKVLLKDAIDARYVPTGNLVFLRRGTLYAVPFDAERLEVRGTPVAMLDGVEEALTGGFGNDITGAGQFAVAANGMLAWVRATTVPYAPEGQLVVLDDQGHVTALPADPHAYAAPLRVSPEGRRLAVTVLAPTEVDPWIYDLNRRTLTRLPMDGEAFFPVWSPDGQHLVMNWLVNGRWSLAMQRADGRSPAIVIETPDELYPGSFLPDGQQLAVSRRDIMLLTIQPRTGIEPLITGPQQEHSPQFSPDGRWLAYCSDVTGRSEIYVRPYPSQGPAELISVEGGDSPAWHPSGRELFYVSLPNADRKSSLMAVDFSPGPPPRIGRPRVRFEIPPNTIFGCSPARCYDVGPDGQHFYAVQLLPTRVPVVTHINLITNWFDELKAKVPVK